MGGVGANLTERGRFSRGGDGADWSRARFLCGAGERPGGRRFCRSGPRGFSRVGETIQPPAQRGEAGPPRAFRGGAAERLFGGNSGGSVFRGTSGGLFLFPPTKGRKRNWAGRLGIAPNRSKRHGRTGQPGEELRDWLNAGDEGKGTVVEAGRTSGRGLAPVSGGPAL
ncbi:MAG: hypothetical protein IPN90_14000 [Elusimicrobia bacterium]|nr:hypothetical protein [Elusimicrobiota bacterium]